MKPFLLRTVFALPIIAALGACGEEELDPRREALVNAFNDAVEECEELAQTAIDLTAEQNFAAPRFVEDAAECIRSQASDRTLFNENYRIPTDRLDAVDPDIAAQIQSLLRNRQ